MDFKLVIAEWAKSELISNEFASRIASIRDFDSKDDFEKVIKAIFYFAELPSLKPDNYKLFMGFDGSRICSLLSRDEILNDFYGGDKTAYRDFLTSLLVSDTASYSYALDFTYYLLHSGYYYIHEFLTATELSVILLKNLERACQLSKKFTLGLWWIMLRCEERVENPLGGSTTEIIYNLNVLAIRLLRKFICEVDIDGFILFSIEPSRNSTGFVINTAIDTVFRSKQLFARLLKRSKIESRYKQEFLKVLDYWMSLGEKDAIIPGEFFQYIPVNKAK